MTYFVPEGEEVDFNLLRADAETLDSIATLNFKTSGTYYFRVENPIIGEFFGVASDISVMRYTDGGHVIFPVADSPFISLQQLANYGEKPDGSQKFSFIQTSEQFRDFMDPALSAKYSKLSIIPYGTEVIVTPGQSGLGNLPELYVEISSGPGNFNQVYGSLGLDAPHDGRVLVTRGGLAGRQDSAWGNWVDVIDVLPKDPIVVPPTEDVATPADIVEIIKDYKINEATSNIFTGLSSHGRLVQFDEVLAKSSTILGSKLHLDPAHPYTYLMETDQDYVSKFHVSPGTNYAKALNSLGTIAEVVGGISKSIEAYHAGDPHFARAGLQEFIVGMASGQVGELVGGGAALLLSGAVASPTVPILVGITVGILAANATKSYLDSKFESYWEPSSGSNKMIMKLMADAVPQGSDVTINFSGGLSEDLVGDTAPAPTWQYNLDTGVFTWLKPLGATEHQRLAAWNSLDANDRSSLNQVGPDAPSNPNDLLFGGWGNDVLSGGLGNDLLAGSRGSDTLQGGVGADTLDGGSTADMMRGGSGNDVYSVDAVGDTVDEGAPGSSGIDTVQSTISLSLAASPRMLGAVEHLTLLGSGPINATGNGLNNVLTGNGGNNLLQGGAGNDTLSGGAGVDRLAGGAGVDLLSGGTGADTYLFTSPSDSGSPALRDRILEFTSGTRTVAGDRIDLIAIDANTSLAGNQAFLLDRNGSFSAGEIRQTLSGKNVIIDFNVDRDAAPEMSLLLINHGLLGAADFVL